MTVVKDKTNVEMLIKLKLLEENESFLDDEFLLKQAKSTIFKKVINKLMLNINSTNINLNFNNLIKEEDFYEIALGLLGYELDIDFTTDNIISFVKNKELFSTGYEKYTNFNFFNHIIELLKAKTKDGKDYFERLCINGVFKDYNEGKEVPEILVFNGKTQPIFDYNESIFEKIYVETPLDTDKDNNRDLIAVYIRRPLETNKGMKVPTIYVASPYMMWCNEDLYNLHNVDHDLEVFPQTNIELEDIQYVEKESDLPEPRKVEGITKAVPAEEIEFDAITPWYNYFLSRGYAIVLSGGIGTSGSEGVRTCGSVEETISTISVIDWLNKRVRGFSNKKDNLEVIADWSNGNVGMTGKSYLGTLAIAAATTGIEGLKTVVPKAAISNWYEYYRCNGLNVSPLNWQGDDADLLAQYCLSRMFDPDDYKKVKDCFDNVLSNIKINEDRITGNYNEFWDERNYLNNANKIKSSVFIVHGLKDWNVKPKQFDMLWKELEKYDVPRKMILHQGDHIYINNLKSIDFTDIMNKWYDYWLYDIENNVMNEIPEVTIQNNAYIDSWDTSNNWPFDDVENIEFFIDKNKMLTENKQDYNEKVTFVDDLSLTGYDRLNPNESKWLNSIVREPDIKKPYRLAYITDVLDKDIRISGTVKFQMKANIDSETGIISAMLVDYGTEKRPSLELKTVEKDAIIYGINAGTDDLVGFVIDEDPTDFNIITRGWMSAQNRRNNYNKDEIIINKDYIFNFDMQPMDYTLLKGHKLGLIIYSTDVEATPRPLKITKFTVHEDSIAVTIPMK